MKAKTNPETKAAYFATEMPEFMAKVEKHASGPACAVHARRRGRLRLRQGFRRRRELDSAIAAAPHLRGGGAQAPEVKQWQEKRPPRCPAAPLCPMRLPRAGLLGVDDDLHGLRRQLGALVFAGEYSKTPAMATEIR